MRMKVTDIPLKTKMDIFENALTERGVVPLHAIDNPLASVMSDIIGALHRMLETRGLTEDQIRIEVERQLINS